MAKVGLITGGASGIGLATAKLFASKGWTIAIADMNTEAGERVASELQGSFHKTNVTDYDNLAQTFADVYQQHGQLDFVFANAGIVEKCDFYAKHDVKPGSTVPKLDTLVLDINLVSVVNTAYLAMHYFRQNQTPGGALVITASSGGLYPVPYLPMYGAAKHGCVGLTRSLADSLIDENIRVNCICPGTVNTGLLKQEEWAKFPQATFTPVENVAKAVELLVTDKSKNGAAVELVQDRMNFRDPPVPEDNALKGMMVKEVGFRK